MSSIDNVGSALYSTVANRQALSASALSRGAAAAQAKDFEVAIREFKRAAAYNPQDANPYRYIGQVYLMMGKRDEAVHQYEKALRLDPQNDNSRLDLAKAYVEAGKMGDAEKEYLKLAKTNPASAEPPTTLGFIYLKSGRLAEADTQFQKVIRMAPNSSTAQYNLGLVRNQQGRFDDAAKLFEQAIAFDPKNENAHADLAFAYMGMDDPKRAKQQYNELVDLGTSSANSLAAQVYDAIETPKFFYNDVTKSDFNTLLGPQTPLSTLDPSLATPGATKIFKMTFTFNQAMDVGSMMNLLNWSITKADGSSNGVGGTYNDGANVNSSQQTNVPISPLSVTYDAKTNSATVYFRITQNAAGDGVIDPKHIVFSFHGKDLTGRTMDKRGDQYDGYSLGPF